MLTEQQVDDLLFSNRTYFDCEDNCSQYTLEELENILTHLKNLSNKYFNRIMKLQNDPYERSDKNTARNIMNNAHNKIYNHYLNKKTIKPLTTRPNISYYIIGGIIFIIIYFIILILLSIVWYVMN